jgi:CrcB protein
MILVGIGGAFGALTRFQLGKMISQKANTVFPIGIIVINISGSVFLGILTAIDVSNQVSLLLGQGFLGAYTTFSTFMYEGFNLFQSNKKKNACTYVVGSLILGIIGYTAGFVITKGLLSVLYR